MLGRAAVRANPASFALCDGMFGYTWHGLRSYRIDYRGGVEVIHRFGLDKVRAARTFPYDELLNPHVVLFSHSVIVKTERCRPKYPN
jgi:hypothetical protein